MSWSALGPSTYDSSEDDVLYGDDEDDDDDDDDDWGWWHFLIGRMVESRTNPIDEVQSWVARVRRLTAYE